jgi:thiol-disulfide isomerase/thioredoxin
MKLLLKNLGLFVVLSIFFSGLIGCTQNASLSPANTAVNTVPTPGANTQPSEIPVRNTPKSNDYPPIAPAIMTAEIKDLDGSTFKLEDLKGKVVLINLWATWCGPCKAEMPELIKMQDEFRDKDFVILGLDSDDESPELVKPFVEKQKLNYRIGWASDALTKDLLKISHFDAIPQSFLIDRDGKLRGVITGADPAKLAQIKETIRKTVSE